MGDCVSSRFFKCLQAFSDKFRALHLDAACFTVLLAKLTCTFKMDCWDSFEDLVM